MSAGVGVCSCGEHTFSRPYFTTEVLGEKVHHRAGAGPCFPLAPRRGVPHVMAPTRQGPGAASPAFEVAVRVERNRGLDGLTDGADPRVLEQSMQRWRDAFRVGCTLVLNKPWPDFTASEQVDALHRAHRDLENEVLLKVPAAMLDVVPVNVMAEGTLVHTLEVTLVVPQPHRLPSASPARVKWAASSSRNRGTRDAR